MQIDRELTTVYVILGQSFVDLEPYDAKGAFVLLNSIAEGLGDAAPRFIDVVSHLHAVAGLGDNEGAHNDARRGLACLVETLKQRLIRGARAGAVS